MERALNTLNTVDSRPVTLHALHATGSCLLAFSLVYSINMSHEICCFVSRITVFTTERFLRCWGFIVNDRAVVMQTDILGYLHMYWYIIIAYMLALCMYFCYICVSTNPM